MAQYQEGQIAIGPNGQQIVFQGGQWVAAGAPQGIQTQTASPSYQYEDRIAGNKAAASEYDPALAKAELDARVREIQVKEAEESRKKITFDKQQAAEARKGDPSKTAIEALNRIIKKIDTINVDAGDNNGWFETGYTGSLNRKRPGTAAYDLAADLETLDANAAFKALQEMRDASPTGGALGAISEKELSLLKSTVANLDPDQSLEQFQANLKNARDVYMGMLAKVPGNNATALGYDGGLAGKSAGGTEATQQRAIAGGPGSRQISQDGFETVSDPARAGANAAVLKMLQSGKSAGEIAGYLKQRNINPIPIMGAIIKNVEFQKKYPGAKPRIEVEQMAREASLGKQVSGAILDNPVGAAGIGSLNGVTAGFSDEIAGALGGNAADAQGVKDYLRGQYPASSFAGEVGGSVLGFKGAGSVLSKAPMLANAGIETAKRTALAGDLAYSGLYGAGEAGEGNRLQGAAIGAAAGLAGNQLGQRVIAPLARKALESAPLKSAVNGVRSLKGQAPFAPPSGLNKVDSAIVKRAGEESLAKMEQAKALNVPFAIADTSPDLRMLAGSAVRKSPAARNFAESTIEPRALGQAERATQAVDQHLYPVGDITAQQEALIAKAKRDAAPLYDQFRDAPGAGAAMEELQPLLGRPAMQDAMRNAQRGALNDGRSPESLGFDFNDAGEVVLNNAPSWETLDYGKRGLDDIIQANDNPLTGGLTSEGRSAQSIKQQLLAIMDARNPAYKQAREAYGGPVAMKQAIADGRKSGNLQPDVLRSKVAGMSPTDREAFSLGYAGNITDAINSTQLTGNPFKRVYGTPKQQQNIAELYPQGADNFGQIAGMESDMAKTAYETLGGSPTKARMEADSLFDGGMAGNVAEIGLAAATGMPPVNALMQGVRNFSVDGARVGFGKAGEQRAAQMAPVLLDTNTQAGIDYLKSNLARRAAYEQWVRQTQQAGGNFGTPLGGAVAASTIYGE